MINPIARLVFWFIVGLVLLAVVSVAKAQTIGQPAQGTFVTCETKQEAINALSVLKKDGREAFEKKFKEMKCGVGQGTGLIVQVLYFVKIEGKTYKVVEMDFGDRIRYWMTSQKLKGGKEI